jgi:hypothetical protein
MSDSALHHTFIDRKIYRWFVKLVLHFISRLLFNSYIMYKESKSNTTLEYFLMRHGLLQTDKKKYFIISSYVRETMEETGIARKSRKDFTPKQMRSISPNLIDRSPKVMTIISQHFSSEISLFTESIFVLLCTFNLF